MTKDTIEEQKAFAEATAYREVCPEATSFAYNDKAQEILGDEGADVGDATINACYVGKDDSGSVVGYALSVTSKGFGGNVTMALGLTPEGEIRKISFTELNETAGLGMRADEEPFKNQFAGKSGSIAYGSDGVEAMSGATVTSTAVKNALNAGLSFYETALKGGN